MVAGDSDDTLVCCIENMVEYHIMDSDEKTLDIARVGDVVLKTSFYTSWTLKDVRYILGLKRRLISIGQLGEEGYHVGFRDQQWKVTKGSLVVAHGNKYGSLYMVEHQRLGDMSRIGMNILASKGNIPDVRKVDIYFYKWFGETEEAFLHNVREDKETIETAAGVSVENDSIVAEHGLSSEITQRPDGSSNTSEAFLHGDLDEDMYMTQPEGFQSVGKEENLVFKLKKSLYGYRDNGSDMAKFNKPKIPCIESLLALCLVSAACSVCLAVQKCKSSSIVEGKVVQSLQRLLEMESSEVISLLVGDC
ncbi:retrovirus-related pol polyprotein from transposon TNT 1-94 [Tanacetum coccineum]|uniref:Retrovirus-related pol polyprotein from transposon TNT 1-94 n=1 Tax=Tanacetum coccineum TaxID=301880 RepID=A0ABQ5F2P2_9ASTR